MTGSREPAQRSDGDGMTAVAVEAAIGLAILVALGSLLVLIIRRRSASKAAADDPVLEDVPPAPVAEAAPQRRRRFGPAAKQTDDDAEPDAPSLPAFVQAAAPLVHEAERGESDLPSAVISLDRGTRPSVGPAPFDPPSHAATFSRNAPHPAIAASHGQAIVLRQAFPPGEEPSRSFYGGVPRVDALFDWPRTRAGDRALHFLLQVDCAAIPAAARLDLLPPSGALLFFADLSHALDAGRGAEGRVIWIDDGSAGEESGWGECTPPDDLLPALADNAASAWPWATDADDAPHILPRWLVTPTAIGLAPARPTPDIDGATWSDSTASADALLAVQGAPAAVFAISPNDFAIGEDGVMARPWLGYPHDWLAIQILAAQLLREAQRPANLHDRVLWPELAGEARMDKFAQIASESGEWHALARTKQPFADVTEPVRAAFWDWLSGYAPLARLVAPAACVAAVETTLHAVPASAPQFPPELIARLAYRHALAVRTATRVHARTPDRLLAAASATEEDQSARRQSHCLLLELVSDDSIGHPFGDHVLQFWITPDDLAQRHFAKAELIVAAA